jgi:hypothetical protein
MNANIFSLYGYIGVLLWLAVPVLWWVSWRYRKSRWICPAALAAALVAMGLAEINTKTHVNRIQPDQSAQVDAARAVTEAKRKAMEATRGDEVADVRFAEDGSEDFLDKGGMEDSDLKYMESLGEGAEPEWKKNKKSRGEADEEKKGLDAKLGGDQAVKGVDSSRFEEKKEKAPIFMSEAHKAMADRLDKINHDVIDIIALLAVIACLVDYLARSNVYSLAFLPLPVPSAIPNFVVSHPPLVDRGDSPRRSLDGELAWLAKRGDCFLLLTDDAAMASAIPTSLPRMGKTLLPVEVLRANHPRITDEFVFEALWYGRSCFVLDSADRAHRIFARFLELMEQRRLVRAKVRQTAHVVWALSHPPSPDQLAAFERLAKATGFSLLVCHVGSLHQPF